MKMGMVVGIILLLIMSFMGGVMSVNAANQESIANGYFVENIFNNGRIMMMIKQDFSRIYTSDGSRILVDKYYPELEVFEKNVWRKVNFTTHIYINTNNEGWHFVTIFMKNTSGNDMISLILTYAEKQQFRLYAPLFPHLELHTSHPLVYRIIWHLEGVGINDFAIIKNETGTIIYNGTLHDGLIFENGQDIIIGYEHGKKMFGLNWENWKYKLPVLEVKKGRNLNIDIESSPQISKAGTTAVPPAPVPDTGSGGGGGTQEDSDGDGVDDSVEMNGWYAWWYDPTGNYHRILVTSNVYKTDTDDDGLSDYYEWVNDLNPNEPDTDGDSMSDYYEFNYGTINDGWQELHWYNERYAVIIVGGGYLDPYEVNYNTYLPAFWNDGLEMYNKLVNDYNYKASNVYLLSSRWYSKYNGDWDWRGENPSTDSRVDGEAMWDSPTHYDIKDALNDISNEITVHDSLLVVIITHGAPEAFVIRNDIPSYNAEEHPDTQETLMYYSDFGNYLNSMFGNGNNKKYAVMIVVNQACYSGTMMSYLNGKDRILITAADSNHLTWTERAVHKYQHWAFIYQGRTGPWPWDVHNGFILSMGSISNPNSMQYCYEKGKDATEHNTTPYSYPQIESVNIDPNKIYL